jgi:hypothetical protein
MESDELRGSVAATMILGVILIRWAAARDLVCTAGVGQLRRGCRADASANARFAADQHDGERPQNLQ